MAGTVSLTLTATAQSANDGIFKWDGQRWTQVPGAATRISAGPDGSPFVVNAWGGIYRWVNGGFQQLPGQATDIGVGADGSVWVIGTDQGIRRWTGQAWSQVPGAAIRVSVGPDGSPWVVNASGGIYRWTNGRFQQLPGVGRDIGVGADGSAWVVGSDQAIYKWNGQNWTRVAATATQISVDNNGAPWIVNTRNEIYRWDGTRFVPVPGIGRDIGIAGNGTAWMIGSAGTQPTAVLTQITVAPASATVSAGSTQQFTASGLWSDGSTGPVSVAWSAASGTISSGGLYTAGATAGTYQVTATQAGGGVFGLAYATVTTATISPPPGSIVITPGQSIQAAVDAAPEGASFWINAGVHRFQSVTPKNRQIFQGPPGTILTGAKALTSFSREGSYWVATGQTQQGPVFSNPEACVVAFPRCGYPEDLFVDNVPLQHVASLSAVGPGKWYFDYAADKIYLADDPQGRTVETSVTATAFAGFARDVTIRGLIIEKYATPTPYGTINGGYSGWVVENNELRWNHHAAVRGTDLIRVRGNNVHHNGGFGFIGTGVSMLFEDNEIAYNNTVGHNPYWGAGGTKWVSTSGLVVRGNFSHHNRGHGLWTDIDNIDTLYEYNRSEDNDFDGIFHELSYRAVIRYNTCQRNGAVSPDPGWVTGAGITVNASPDVEVYGNTIVNNFNGIGGIQTPRGSGKYGPYLLQNFNVHHNTVTMTVGQTGIVQYGDMFSVYTSQNNRFVDNTYYLGPKSTYFTWSVPAVDENRWRSFGNDVNGTFSR